MYVNLMKSGTVNTNVCNLLYCRQSCVSEAVTILSSRFFIDNFPDKLNTIVLALLPLVFVGYHGNKQCRHILHVIAGSPLSQVHQILKEIENVCKCEGESNFALLYILIVSVSENNLYGPQSHPYDCFQLVYMYTCMYNIFTCIYTCTCIYKYMYSVYTCVHVCLIHIHVRVYSM